MTAASRSNSGFRRRCLEGSALLLLALAAGTATARAQGTADPDAVRTPHRIVSFEHVNRQVVLKCDVGVLLLSAFADNVLHVRYLPRPLPPAPRTKDDVPSDEMPKYRVDAPAGTITLATSMLAVSVDRRTAQLTFMDAKRNVILSGRQYGLRAANMPGESTYAIHAEFLSPEDEAYFGLGQEQGSMINLRGRIIRLPLDGLEGAVALPFLTTNRKYGFVLDNLSAASVALGIDGLTTWDAEAGQLLSFFVIFGETPEDLNKAYQLITAR